MPREFHDIVPPQKRSIRNISKVSMNGRPLRRPLPHVEAPRDPRLTSTPRVPNNSEQEQRERRMRVPFFVAIRRPSFALIIAILVIFVGLFFIFSLIFSGSKVTIIPKQQETFVDATFEAFRDGSNMLLYQDMTVEKTGSEVVSATERRNVEERANGRIVIFNNHDTASQRLITNTRFQTLDGLIYRISEPIIVPGMTKKEDGTVVPGSIEADVYADEPGERYNIGLTDFTIPGFAGSPRFEGFFARSKTSMAGGFVGEKLVVNPDVLKKTKENITQKLRGELTTLSFAQKPDGFHLFEDGLFIDFTPLPDEERENGVEVRIKGVLHGILFEEGAFAEYIAARTLAGYDGEPVSIENADSLIFTVTEKETVRPWENDSLTFSLTGSALVVWEFDEMALAEDLRGRSKDALPTILQGYPSILRAEIVLRPFWRTTFPDDPADIAIERALDE